ncbi:hypothetical protein KCP78_18680 [Salmonella enterica subsp. enterica]|nr:hypothetical protein KCP78_18680 [Salmonella enterica subsp. enterica]
MHLYVVSVPETGGCAEARCWASRKITQKSRIAFARQLAAEIPHVISGLSSTCFLIHARCSALAESSAMPFNCAGFAGPMPFAYETAQVRRRQAIQRPKVLQYTLCQRHNIFSHCRYVKSASSSTSLRKQYPDLSISRSDNSSNVSIRAPRF